MRSMVGMVASLMACGTQAGLEVNVGKETPALSDEQIVRSFPGESEFAYGLNVGLLRNSVAVAQLWTIVAGAGAAVGLDATQTCVGSFAGFAYSADRVLGGGLMSSEAGVFAWVLGVDRAAYEQCRAMPANKRMLAVNQMSEYVDGDMVVQRSPAQMQQFLWYAPRVVVAVTNRKSSEPMPARELRSVGGSAYRSTSDGMLSRPAMRDLFYATDRTAAVWVISDAERIHEGVKGVSIWAHVGGRVDLTILIRTTSHSVASELQKDIEVFGKKWQREGLFDGVLVTVKESSVEARIGAGPKEIERVVELSRGRLIEALTAPTQDLPK